MTAGPAGGFNIGHVLAALTGADQFGGGFIGGLRGIGHSMMQHYRDANGITTPAAVPDPTKVTAPMLDAKTLMDNYFAGKQRPPSPAMDISQVPMAQAVKNFAPTQIAGTPWGQGSWSGPRP